MRSWSIDWLLRAGWEEDLASKALQRTLGSHLVHLFRQAISSNILRPGDRLPSARDLTKELRISRNTATFVYEQLCAEGYVVSRVGSGTFVSAVTPAMVHRASLAGLEASPAASLSVELSSVARQVLDRADATPDRWGAFTPGIPDVTAFPRAAYARIVNRLWRHAQPTMLMYDTTGGALPLKSVLVDYLRLGRGVKCRPEQVLITDGSHQALDLAMRCLVAPQDSVWIENPGYQGAANLAKMVADVQLVWASIDAEGLHIDPQAAPPKLIYVTPSHQYPSGVVMSARRREELIAYACAHKAWILEDDYDSEFRFGGKHLPAMQGMGSNVPAIYIGTFSKTLFPGLRVGYMVLPEELVDSMTRLHSELYRPGDLVTQLALAEFIREGHYTKHIRKMRVVYGRRREWLRKLIVRHLGKQFLSEIDSFAGLHLVLHLPSVVDDVRISETLEKIGVHVKPLSEYFQSGMRKSGLVLGYAAVPEADIQHAFFKLLQVLKDFGIDSAMPVKTVG